MKTLSYTLLTLIGVAGLFYGMFLMTKGGLEAHEKHECLMWQEQAEQFDGFYLTNWQKEQCSARGINVK